MFIRSAWYCNGFCRTLKRSLPTTSTFRSVSLLDRYGPSNRYSSPQEPALGAGTQGKKRKKGPRDVTLDWAEKLEEAKPDTPNPPKPSFEVREVDQIPQKEHGDFSDDCTTKEWTVSSFSSQMRGNRRTENAGGIRARERKLFGLPERYSGPRSCIAFCTANEYDLNRLQSLLVERSFSPQIFEGVLHIQYDQPLGDVVPSHLMVSQMDMPDPDLFNTKKNRMSRDSRAEVVQHGSHRQRDVFFFKDGTMVGWGITPADQYFFINLIQRKCEVDRFPTHVEELDYYTSDHEDTITRFGVGPQRDSVLLADWADTLTKVKEKLAFSYALVRTLRLEVVENLLDKNLELMKNIPHDLGRGVLPSDKDWMKIMSEQLKIRAVLNLHSELLETPDMYWDDRNLEDLFLAMHNELDIPNRIAILNKRLDYTQEVSDVVRSYLGERSSHNLEKIIIVLISLEVLLYMFDKSVWWQQLTVEKLFHIELPVEYSHHASGHHSHGHR